MGGGLRVDAAELRASAGFARTAGEELGGPVDAALRDNSVATARLAGWSIGPALERIGADWAPALAALRARLADTAASLEAAAQGHEWTDHSVAELMTGTAAR
ncbi:hypothetical protein GCM10009760_32740 [Kitasatospora kazusensis]|uniref:Excreted virulence factor EspC (Type VII ESX diderm) n=1 Tax=Kitasatospora kazusensis TaxID=407974 RepID=A0ABN2ZN29_9ACTN